MITHKTPLNECFDYFDLGDNGAQVVPVTVNDSDDDCRLAIFIHGNRLAASVIMAELMSKVDELYDLQAQAEAVIDEPKSPIIT